MSTTIEALQNLYVASGGALEDVQDKTIIPDMINALAALNGIKPVEAVADSQNAEYWGTAVSSMQSADSAVHGSVIEGTLKYVESGSLVDTWGLHHFLALRFIDPNGADDIKVGIDGSASLDSDMICIFAVESTEKNIKVQIHKNGIVKTQIFDLSGLTLEEQN